MTSWLLPLLAWGLGLVIGSFLNVVIERLPRMLERRWREECMAEWQAQNPSAHAEAPAVEADVGNNGQPPLSLAQPASHCPHCQSPIRWYDNLPLIGFVRLRGRCRHCGQAISWRYPLVEMLTGVWFAAVFLMWGPTITALCWAAWGAVLIALSCIDAQHQLLPDNLTLPLCWAGLLASTLGWITVDPISAIWGAAMGYLMLWVVARAYELLRGQAGMGQGDFKLLASLGAWLGWQNLSLVLLIACLLGITHGLLRPRAQRLASPHFAFGPSLCLAAVAVVCWGRGQPVWLGF